MAINTPAESLIILPKEILNHIKNASAEELKTLLCFFATPEISVPDAARDTGLTVAQVESACAFWRGAGVFQESTGKSKKAASDTSSYRNYDSATLSQAIKENEGFKLICQVAEQNMQKQLSKNDYSALYYLYDFCGMPSEVVCGIIEHCCAMDKRNSQYIYKVGVSLHDQGIDSYEKFEKYLAQRELANSNIGKLRKLFGMGDRALTSKEKKLFDCWFIDWSFSYEMVELAYEKTVDSTGKHSTTYMNGILRRWHESGFTTPEEVSSGDGSGKTSGISSFEGDEFIEAALNRGFDD
ncbi:MAG: DnaD domain protein [Clostridia bacterium]|nr:DnaD domain protein [Clostridia bacterium]